MKHVISIILLSLFAQAGTYGADKCILFSGDGDYLEATKKLIPATSDFTIEFYVYIYSEKRQYEEFISQGSQPHPFYVGFSSTSTLRFGDSWERTELTLPVSKWSHIAITHNSANEGKVYIDGIKRGESKAYYLQEGTSNTRIASQFGSTPSELFSGCLDDLKIWGRVRSDTEIAQDIQKGVVNESSYDLIAYYSFDADISDGALYDSSGSADKKLKVYGNPILIRYDSPSEAPIYHSACGLSNPSTPNDNNGNCYGAYFSSTIQETIPLQFRDGFSYYAWFWPLYDTPLKNAQAGLGSTWINPDTTYLSDELKSKLCDFSLSGFGGLGYSTPSEAQLWQSIEGSLGYWIVSNFRAATPKYKLFSTPNCYEYGGDSAPGWAPIQDISGLAQISNKILMPPDGFTFTEESSGGVLGVSWMSTSIPAHKAYDARDKNSSSWMLFFNSSNFKGPVAYYTPEYWSDYSSKSGVTAGYSLGSNSGYVNSFSAEFGTIPYFEIKDQTGNIYSKIPTLQFPSDAKGRTNLVSDMKSYSRKAIQNNVDAILSKNINASTAFDESFAHTLRVGTWNHSFQQGWDPIEFNSTFNMSVFDEGDSFGMIWPEKAAINTIPQYYIKENGVRKPTSESTVPSALLGSTFLAPAFYKSITKPEWWTESTAATFPISTELSDGTTVRYVWYRFVDQPAISRLKLPSNKKSELQSFVEGIHKAWLSTSDYIPPPKNGELVTFDKALIVTPPAGLEYGYVPIPISQSGSTAYTTEKNPIYNESSIFWRTIKNSKSSLFINKYGEGLVLSNPDGINCGSTCTASFGENSNVTLTAIPNAGYSFSGWSGACSGTASCTIAMDSNKQVTATFTEIPLNPYEPSKPFVKPNIPNNVAVVKQTFTIGWQLNLIRKNMPVRVKFAKDGGAFRVIKSTKANAAGVGAYRWKPTKAQRTANGQLQICAVPSKGIAEVCSPTTSITVQ